MELQEFLKQKDTMEFITTDGGYYRTHTTVLKDIRNKMEEWISAGEPEETVKEAIERILSSIEPVNKKLDKRVDTLWKKWGLPIEQ